MCAYVCIGISLYVLFQLYIVIYVRISEVIPGYQQEITEVCHVFSRHWRVTICPTQNGLPPSPRFLISDVYTFLGRKCSFQIVKQREM